MSREANDRIAALRRRIDELDARISDLLNERAGFASEIGSLKRSLGWPVYDPERESEILDRLQREGKGPLTAAAVRRIFERILDESRRLERMREEAGAGGDTSGVESET